MIFPHLMQVFITMVGVFPHLSAAWWASPPLEAEEALIARAKGAAVHP
jgi:hypothetical protein